MLSLREQGIHYITSHEVADVRWRMGWEEEAKRLVVSPSGSGRCWDRVTSELVVIRCAAPVGALPLTLSVPGPNPIALLFGKQARAAATSKWNDRGSKGPRAIWRGHAAQPSLHPALESSVCLFPW